MTYPHRPHGAGADGGLPRHARSGSAPAEPSADARTGWPPSTAPTGPAVLPPAGGRPPRSRRPWIVAAALAVAATGTTTVLVLGGHGRSIAGQPEAATGTAEITDAHAAAVFFAGLEARRYNAAEPAPQPTRTTYGAVSCPADLAQMAATGPPLPASTPHPRYVFTVTSITADRNGRDQLVITATDTATGQSGGRLFYLQQQAGWRVCGLYQNTAPPSTATGTPGENAGSGGSTQSASADVQNFLNNFASAVGQGAIGTAAMAICTQDPAASAADGPVETWTRAHAHIQVESPVDTSGSLGIASTRIQVSQSGQPPVVYGLLIEQQAGTWCIDQVQQES